MKKAQTEIDSVLGQDGPTLDSLKKLEYVPMTFTEVFPVTCSMLYIYNQMNHILSFDIKGMGKSESYFDLCPGGSVDSVLFLLYQL